MEKKFFQKPTVYVGEVMINVKDLDRSIKFYRDFMGFKVLEEGDGHAVLTVDGKTKLLTLIKPDNVTDKQGRTTGLFHFAILLPTRAYLSSFLRHLVENNVQIGASDHLVSEALYFSDPDGNGIEVYRDRLEAEWSWSSGEVAMATEPLDGQGLLAESNEPWLGMPEDTVIGHIHLHVSELEKTEEFYTKGLGFTLVTQYPGALFISTGGYHHHIGLNIWNGVGAPPPPKNSVGLKYFTLEIPDEPSLEKILEGLKTVGASIEKSEEGFLVEDPSKNRILLRIN